MARNKFKSQAGLIVIALVLASGVFGLGYRIGVSASSVAVDIAGVANRNTGAPASVDFSPFWRAWQTLEDRFVPATSTEAVTDQQKVWGAIQGLTNAYGDPYTIFLPPREKEIFESSISGSFGGVGMEIGIREGVLTVISPLKNTPAERAGILAGDQIIKIDSEVTQGLSIDEAVESIRGEKGTQVTLTIVRKGTEDPLNIKVTRDTIRVPAIETEELGEGIFAVRIYSFSALAPSQFRQSLREFIISGNDKLILDLRGNPGGFLEAAVDMASFFLPQGKVVVTEDYGRGGEGRVHRSRGYDVFSNSLQMVILVNGGSASASEILAGALSEHGIATIVGTQTFGKGSVQELVDITGNTQLKVTVARWLTPEGHSISENGITPDVVIELTAEDMKAERDPQQEKAVEILRSL